MNKPLVVFALFLAAFFIPAPSGIVEIKGETKLEVSADWTFVKPLVRKVVESQEIKTQDYKPPVLGPNDHHVAVIKFNTEVSNASAAAAIKALNQINAAGAEMVLIIWDTPGGSVHAGQRLAQVIEESKAITVCLVDPLAASMGAYLISSCQIRLMTRRSELLLHEPSVRGLELSGNPKDFKNAYERLRSLSEAMLEQYARKSRLSKEEIRKHIENGQDWWMNWEEALKFGFVDGIVENAPVLYKSLVKTGQIPLSQSAS